MSTDELEAAFTHRWRQLELDETLRADVTIRPRSGSTLAASAPGHPVSAPLPRISLASTEDPGPGERAATRASDLRVLSTLGEGGMGRVHLARQRSLDREVAVKTLRPGAPDRARETLLAEAAVTGSLEHPGIIPVHALGIDDTDRPVLVMKRVEGTEWRALVHDADHPAWADLPASEERLDAHIDILMQICNALHFAHSRGIVHRDVKPENVMVGPFGEVYLVDWGVATQMGKPPAGELVGTPGYMAPEMVNGGAVDARTDVYLLGATLHEVLTGELRNPGSTVHQVMLSAFMSEPHTYPPSVPQELGELCNRATSRDPRDRPQSALELRKALVDYRKHRASVALAAGAAERLSSLREAIPDDPGEPVEDIGAAYRLSTECRFGYTQALHEWPRNPAARRGLEDCLGVMADLELRQGNVAGARALLAELSEARPDLEQRLQELERSQRERQEREARLRRLEHDMDENVAAPQRTRALIVLGLLALGISGFAIARGTEQLRTQDMLVFALILLGGALLGLGLFRHRLLENAFNRRAAGMLFLAIGGLTGNRLLAFSTGGEVHETFVRDLIILTVVTTAAGITLARWAWPIVGVYATGLVVAALFPATAAYAFSLSSLVAIGSLVAAWRLRSRS